MGTYFARNVFADYFRRFPKGSPSEWKEGLGQRVRVAKEKQTITMNRDRRLKLGGVVTFGRLSYDRSKLQNRLGLDVAGFILPYSRWSGDSVLGARSRHYQRDWGINGGKALIPFMSPNQLPHQFQLSFRQL
jgi:hypothetical protein